MTVAWDHGHAADRRKVGNAACELIVKFTKEFWAVLLVSHARY